MELLCIKKPSRPPLCWVLSPLLFTCNKGCLFISIQKRRKKNIFFFFFFFFLFFFFLFSSLSSFLPLLICYALVVIRYYFFFSIKLIIYFYFLRHPPRPRRPLASAFVLVRDGLFIKIKFCNVISKYFRHCFKLKQKER